MISCSSCTKNWAYPFSSCPACGGKTEKVSGGKRIVKGATQVFVPSREHPVAPYFVLLLQDEENNFSAVKTFQAYKIGEEYSAFAKKSGVKKIGVVGSGTMGVGIASLCASSGFAVVVKSRKVGTALQVVEAIRKRLSNSLDEKTVSLLMKSVSATEKYSDLSSCNVVIESVSEIAGVKKKVFEELDAATPPTTVLATNTSSLSVTELASATKHPERVAGMHFFNPVSRMQLVEVISGKKTSKKSSQTIFELAAALGKTPINVRDTPGFIVNRLLLPFLNDAVLLLEQNVASKEEIDSAVKLGLNHPMGPLELIDLIGVDVFVEIMHELEKQTGDNHYAPAKLALQMIEEGKLGRKTKQGFYGY